MCKEVRFCGEVTTRKPRDLAMQWLVINRGYNSQPPETVNVINPNDDNQQRAYADLTHEGLIELRRYPRLWLRLYRLIGRDVPILPTLFFQTHAATTNAGNEQYRKNLFTGDSSPDESLLDPDGDIQALEADDL